MADQVLPDPSLLWVWRCWWRLHRGDRPWVGGMGAMPMHLPWTVVMRWADAHHYNEAEIAFLDACLGAMDEQFMEIHNEQQRLAREAGKTKT